MIDESVDTETLKALNITNEGLAKLDAENKNVFILKGAVFFGSIPWAIVVRKPTSKEYKRFRAMLHSGGDADRAGEVLVRSIVVHPSVEATDALLEEWPGIPEAATDLVLRLVGAKAQETGK